MNKKVIYWVIFALTLIGLGVSIHLLQIDYNVKFDSNYVPECDFNSTISCSKVADSKYSSILGVPVASWGIMGYLFILIFMLTSKKSKKFYSSLLFFFFIFSVGSVYFFIIAKLMIGAICLFCIATYVVNWLVFLLLIFSVFKLKYDEDKFCIKDNVLSFFEIPVIIIPIYLIVSVAIIAPSYIVFSKAHTDTVKIVKHGDKENTYKNGHFNKEKLYGVAGVKDAKIEFVLYSDYECPYCSRFETTVKGIAENFSNVEVIRKEFPLDNKCNMLLGDKKFHKHACDAAFFAKCAGLEGKFWEAADILHANRKDLAMDSLLKYSKQLNINKDKMIKCMKSESIINAVKLDIKDGLKLGVRGTPAFTINGKIIKGGALPYDKLSKILIEKGGVLINPENAKP